MPDLTYELMSLKGISEILWVLASFTDSDMKSMDECFYVLNRILDDTISDIESKISPLDTCTAESPDTDKILK